MKKLYKVAKDKTIPGLAKERIYEFTSKDRFHMGTHPTFRHDIIKTVPELLVEGMLVEVDEDGEEVINSIIAIEKGEKLPPNYEAKIIFYPDQEQRIRELIKEEIKLSKMRLISESLKPQPEDKEKIYTTGGVYPHIEMEQERSGIACPKAEPVERDSARIWLDQDMIDFAHMVANWVKPNSFDIGYIEKLFNAWRKE